MKVYFIRHGQSEGNRLHLHCGWSDTPLSELGHQQARAANAYLKDIPFDRIYCSDVPRARQTAADALHCSGQCKYSGTEKVKYQNDPVFHYYFLHAYKIVPEAGKFNLAAGFIMFFQAEIAAGRDYFSEKSSLAIVKKQ